LWRKGDVIERKIEVAGKRGRRFKQLLNDLKERGGYWKLKEKAQHRSLWRTGLRRSCDPVLRQRKT